MQNVVWSWLNVSSHVRAGKVSAPEHLPHTTKPLENVGQLSGLCEPHSALVGNTCALTPPLSAVKAEVSICHHQDALIVSHSPCWQRLYLLLGSHCMAQGHCGALVGNSSVLSGHPFKFST
eukprot:1162062-Pelagomonas_calceolata.AAC.22